MAGKHGKNRKRSRQIKKITTLGTVTMTATALTVGATPLPDLTPDSKKVVDSNVHLAAAVNPWPSPGQLPDLTGGLGTFGYDLTQTVIELALRAVVENINLAALAQAAGLDLPSLLESLLGDPDFLLNDVLGPVLGAIPIDLAPALTDVLSLVLGDIVGSLLTETVLVPVLSVLGITDAQGVTDLLKLLGLVGLDLSDPLNLAGLDIPGLNVITAGPAFTALKLLGVDLGWVPGLPNAVAGEINGTPYLEVGAVGLLNTLLDELTETLPGNLLIPALQGIINDLLGEVLPDVVHLRVPVSVGIGMGAFALATGYEKVLADLANQPGGANYQGLDPLLGSFTILPMLLAFNPARPNGGALARFYPLFDLLGINTVNPETEASSSCGNLLCVPVLGTGLTLGGANLLPILIDLGVQYHPSSDLAAWPNPFSLANNLAAGVLPTYMLRGLTLDTVTAQLEAELAEILAGVAEGDPLAINLYLTLPSATQPLLEPLYLISDIISIATLGAGAVNPVGMFANAIAPAVAALNNLGYTDVVRNPDGTYTRTLTEGGVPTPFLSFPAGINPLQVPVDVVNLLIRGFQKEFFSGNPTPATPNAILNLLELLTGGGDLLGGLPLGDLGDLVKDVVDNLVGGLNPLDQTQEAMALSAATDLPSADARMVPLSATEDTEGESPSDTTDSEVTEKTEEVVDEPVAEEEPVDEEEVAEEEPAEEEPTDEEEEPAEEEPVDEDSEDTEDTEDEPADEEAEDEADDEAGDGEEAETGPKHAKPNTGESVTSISGASPRHAKADNDTAGDTAGGSTGSNDGASDGAAA